MRCETWPSTSGSPRPHSNSGLPRCLGCRGGATRLARLGTCEKTTQLHSPNDQRGTPVPH
eukprot:1018954-Alexandrium_andersonii.AAC.1